MWLRNNRMTPFSSKRQLFLDKEFDLLLQIGNTVMSPVRLTSYVYSHSSSISIHSCMHCTWSVPL